MQRRDKSEEKVKVRTKTGTFRIEQDILDRLSRESKLKSESVNLLVNKILKSYVNWHKPLYESGNIYFSKALLAKLFNSITDEQLSILAEEHVRNELKEELNMLGQQYNLQSYLDAVCSWCEACGFSYRYDETNDADVYTIRFDLGEKWARFFGKFVHVIAEHFKVKNLKQEVINGTVIFKIQR